jgi:hypothetical protein
MRLFEKSMQFANSAIFLTLYKSYSLSILLFYANLCSVPFKPQISKIESFESFWSDLWIYLLWKKGSSHLRYDQRLEKLNLDSLQLRKN